ncbi:RING-H2 finger protein ATL39-like [Papaver somniferum]|uniref:RING-H2 finger protein ATL39-like n=1 Tax=Papaver somniferum TaxID=3469 RepID=UPI000E6F50B1|nr:RING-H2 finger protein ATL39-like [Papaver somniferum]
MAGLICAFLFMVVLAIYNRRCFSDRRSRGDSSVQSIGDVTTTRKGGLDSTVIKTFPVFVYPDVKNFKMIDTEETAVLECAVCLSEFEDEDVLRQLPTCRHAFHADCIDVWFVSQSTCPVCRDNLKQIAPGIALNADDDVVIDVLEDEENGPEMAAEMISETEDQHHVSISVVDNSGDVIGSTNLNSEMLQNSVKEDR